MYGLSVRQRHDPYNPAVEFSAISPQNRYRLCSWGSHRNGFSHTLIHQSLRRYGRLRITSFSKYAVNLYTLTFGMIPLAAFWGNHFFSSKPLARHAGHPLTDQSKGKRRHCSGRAL